MARMFGTDGVRGVAGSELSIELATKLGQAEHMSLQKSRNIRQQLSLDVIQEYQEVCLRAH